MIKKAIIPVAGRGTRMAPISNVIAKEMLPIGTRPTLQFIVEEAVSGGVEEILFVINPDKMIIPKYFSGTDSPEMYEVGRKTYPYECLGKTVRIGYTFQLPIPGSGGAVLSGEYFADGETVAILFGDDIFVGRSAIGQLIEISERYGDKSVLGVQIKEDSVVRACAAIEVQKDLGNHGVVKHIVEKPQGVIPSNLTSLGRFVLSAKGFEVLRNTQQHRGELWLTEGLDNEAQVNDVYYMQFEGIRYDIGNRYGYIRAFRDLALLDEEDQNKFQLYLADQK
jgi:UTP--glucose-1-phosphate uridylyltransferase